MIESGKTVSIEYTLKLEDGTTADSNVGGDPLTYQQGAGQILPALEEALQGQKAGDTVQVELSADQGYGQVDEQAYHEVPAERVPEDARTVGTVLLATDPSGNQQQIRVHEIGDETITLDFNHPLAGEALAFDVKVLDVR